jgi:uncharacterized protein (TIGR02246 family)
MNKSARALIAVFFSWCAVASAAESDSLTVAIRERVEAYVAAYNQPDAQALADLWAEDAVYVNRDTGETIEGRAAIAEMFAGMFAAGDAPRLAVTLHAVRSITDNVAIEDGTVDLIAADGSTTSTTYTAIHVERDGVWYLHSVRETDTPAPPELDHGELEQLSWLIGEWVDDSEDAAVHTACGWAKNERFLTSAFSVSVDGQIEIEGTQVIGWDAAAEQIRSWVFDTEGGIGEGVWRRVGDQWIVDSTMTLADGSQGSATNVYTPIDDNSYTWKSVDRQIDGQPQPDVDEVTVRRQEPAVAADEPTPAAEESAPVESPEEGD